jgi:hypothetical protein
MICLSILYFLPMAIAIYRSHPKVGRIVLVNLLLGCTQIGWVVALIWATSAIKEEAQPQGAVDPDDDW